MKGKEKGGRRIVSVCSSLPFSFLLLSSGWGWVGAGKKCGSFSSLPTAHPSPVPLVHETDIAEFGMGGRRDEFRREGKRS